MAGESDVAGGGDDLLDKTFKAGFIHIYLLANKKKKASSSSLLRVFERTGSVLASLARLNGATQHSNSGAQSVGSAAKSRQSVASASTAASGDPKKRNQIAVGDAVAQLPLTLALALPQPTQQSAAPAASKRTVVHRDDSDAPKLDALRASQPTAACVAEAEAAEVQAVWSGKVMDAASSQKFLKFITSGPPTSTRASLLAAGSFKASAKRTLLGGRSSKTQDERAAAESVAEDDVLQMLREEFPDQVVVLPAAV
eukprot:gene11332-8057_t